MSSLPQRSLEWRVFADGRLYLAMGWRGYYELNVGGRAYHAEFISRRLELFDLGACSFDNLRFCQAVCDEHNRLLIKVSGPLLPRASPPIPE